VTEYFPVMYVPMPLNANGDGPADAADAVSVAHEVWDTETNVTICTAKDEATANLIVAAWNLRAQAPDSWRPEMEAVDALLRIRTVFQALDDNASDETPVVLKAGDVATLLEVIAAALRPKTPESGK